MKHLKLFPALLCLAGASLWAEEPAEPAPPVEAEPLAITRSHTVEIDGERVEYTSTFGWLILRDDDGTPIARFGYTAYTRDGVRDTDRRPLMFAFNGGPGSSSIWLHMGVLGPERALVNDAGFAPPPPARRTDNAFSIIDVTDLVMVDPVGTGMSRPLGKAEGKRFWGVDQDIRSVGQFVREYVTQNGRWASPKYILGESYGGIRSAGLVHHLQSEHSMHFNGVILVSPFLSMGSGIDGAHNDLPHALYLSTFAATARYHGALGEAAGDLESFVGEVEAFALGEYMDALLKGYTIPADEKARVAGRLAGYTGVSEAFWLRADLRVSHGQFLQELMRDERVVTGRIDGRFLGPALNPLAENMDYDPFFPSVGPAYVAAFMDYLREELGYEGGETYRASAFGEVGQNWDWAHKPPQSSGWAVPWADLRPDLAVAITTNPGLHVLVQQGYYDLATPIGATRYDLAHLDIPTEARARIREAWYEAGHMMYLHEPSLRRFRVDLARFIRDSDGL